MINITRICIVCGCNIFYKTISQKNDAEKNNRCCKLCSNRRTSANRKYSGQLTKTCVQCNSVTQFSNVSKYKNSRESHGYLCKSCAIKKCHTGKVVSMETKLKMSKNHIGLKVTDATRKKLSAMRIGKLNPMYGKTGNKAPMYGKSGKLSPTFGKTAWNKGKTASDSTLLKMRLSAINRLQLTLNGSMLPSYNPSACQLIEEYGKENGYNFQHAMNGGEYYIKELGYWVDGYDKEQNVVIEIDEKRHFDCSGNLKKNDIRRQLEIEKFLNCKFIRVRL